MFRARWRTRITTRTGSNTRPEIGRILRRVTTPNRLLPYLDFCCMTGLDPEVWCCLVDCGVTPDLLRPFVSAHCDLALLREERYDDFIDQVRAIPLEELDALVDRVISSR